MPYATDEIVKQLRETRERKPLSQRELSQLSGVPQAQISRIESNSIDLRLSTLIAIAHALDLEIALVPRKAVPAIKSITRQTMDAASIQAPEIAREMRRLRASIHRTQVAFPSLPQNEDLRSSFMFVQQWPIPANDFGTLRSIRVALERAIGNHSSDDVADVINDFRSLRNRIAHAPPASDRDDQTRPAYSLDEDDDG
ncbi:MULTISPECIES: helix-turn-helix transcriptional regulator [unclassified Rhizobium]|uniref:helix-turn-helix domain-containing protein n=1 Tax=unclassified Rhizobium TaxID=2613769 RepID=UPI000B52C11E|nr:MULTISPECIES: helix-turn-helix transcriptional regulator [unclassified Rhizobium]